MCCTARPMGWALALCLFAAAPFPAIAEKAQKSTPVYEESFEAGTADWNAAPGLSLHQDSDARSGRGALLVTGKEPGKQWSYATASHMPLQAGKRYRLSTWMKVEKIAPASKAPALKVGVFDAQKKWVNNFTTKPYDLGKLGTWQLLDITFEMPANCASGNLALEKGVQAQEVEVTLKLDEVKLEMLAAP